MVDDYKDIEVSKRKWRITKFDARTGSKIIKKLLPIAASFLGGNKGEKPEDVKIDMGSLIAALSDIKDEDFDYIQSACLKVTTESLGAGFAPVINDNGTYGVIGIENDTMTVLALTAHALVFNVTGFFQDTPLAGIVEGMTNTFQQNLPT